ncbi:MAG: hypothetical protein H7Y09_13940 [Chitinophagaceae bacterium]|nr:hypothetical protein [Anaerolineae bacterium]
MASTDTISHVDPEIVLLTINGETLETTLEHPFYTLSGEWVAAADLRPGDRSAPSTASTAKSRRCGLSSASRLCST